MDQHERSDAPPAAFDLYAAFSNRDRRDSRLRQLSLAVAVLVHVAILCVHWPTFATEARTADDEEPVILVLQNVRFQQPPPEAPLPPQPRTRRVPVPDPTPDEPEPLRQPAPPEPMQVDLDATILASPPVPPPPAEPSGPLRVGGTVDRPQRIHFVQPRYTEPAMKVRLEGIVVLECVIDRQGSVRDITVLRGLSMGLTEAAVDAVRHWRYTPTTLDGVPVDIVMTVTVRFSVD
jgi:protein TonB